MGPGNEGAKPGVVAVLELETNKGFRLLERAPGVSVDEIRKATAAPLLIEGSVPEMTFQDHR